MITFNFYMEVTEPTKPEPIKRINSRNHVTKEPNLNQPN